MYFEKCIMRSFIGRRKKLMGGYFKKDLGRTSNLYLAWGFYILDQVYKSSEYARVLVICSPGNNAGNGLAAARHLHHFGYKLQVCYPNCAPKSLYMGRVTQLESLSVPFLSIQSLPPELLNFDILIDAIFGSSFQGNPGPPCDGLVENLVSLSEQDQTR